MATDHNFKVKNGLIVDGGEIYLQGVATPQIFFNGNADAGIDMAIKATPESLDFYEPEDNDKLHMRIIDDAGVNAVFGFRTGAGDGTLRIDDSGNATLGTISSGAITTSGTFTGHNINLRNDTAGDGAIIRDISFLTTAAQGADDRVALIRASNEGGDGTNRGGKFTFYTRQSSSGGFNSALILDKDGNSTFAGTISSGAITSTGTILTDGTASNSVPKYSFSGDTDTGLGYVGTNTVGLIAGGSRKFYVNATNAFFQNLTGGVSVPLLSIGSTTVIDASRNATFAKATLGSGTNYPLQVSSTQRYQIQIRNENNTVNSSYGWWLATDTNFNFALHADGSADKFTLTRDGNATFAGTISSGAITSTVVNTGDATFLTLHHDTGADLNTQRSFIDFSFEDDNTNETPQVRIGAQVGQNADADSQEKEGSGAFVVYTNNAESVSGAAGTSLAERMRVDYQGNVLIGKTASDFATAGAELAKDGTPGKVQFSRASNPLSLNNITNNGNIISFYKGAGAVGDIGIEGGDSLYIQAGTTSGSGLRFHPSGGTVEPVRNGVTINNTISLGSTNRQFKDAYFEKVYVRQNTTQTGAVLEFSDEPSSWSQNGSITFRHVDTQSYGSGAMFEIGSDQPTTTILAQGKLYFSEGLYTKPASGTGVGTLRISSSGNATLGTIAATTITATGTDLQQYRLLHGTAVAGGIFKERTITGAGVSNDVCIFAESITDGGNIHFMTGGSATIRATIASDGDASFGGSLGVSGPITSSSVLDLTVGAVSGAVMGANRSLGINATEAQIHLVAHNTGDWASNIVLTNHSDSATRHYWIHNAPATASYNANKFELRTSTTTTASEIGGQGSGSSAILVIDSSGNTTTKGNISIDAADGFVYLNNDGVGNAGIYVRGIGSSDTLRSHSTDNFRWEVLGSQKMELTNSGHLTVTGNLNGAIINGASLNVTGTTKFGDTAGSPAADIHVYGTGNNYLRLRGTAANDYEIDLEGTSSTGQLVFNQFDLKTNNNIIIDGSSKYLIIENHAETDTGIIFNDGDASTGGNWNGSSSQAFKIQYHCGNETLIMGHDNDSYAGFNFAIGGNFTASGNVTAYSDERLKENIETLDGSKVLQMRGVSFTKEGKQGSGVIAQELEKVAPELVIEGEYKSVAYGNLVGYLIENAKQQQERIEKLEELVYRLMSEK